MQSLQNTSTIWNVLIEMKTDKEGSNAVYLKC